VSAELRIASALEGELRRTQAEAHGAAYAASFGRAERLV